MASNSILASMAVALTANVSDFQRGMAAARKELRGFQKAGEAMKGLGESMSTYLSAPLAGLAAISLKTAGDIQALQKGLQAVSGSAEAADAQFKSLKEVAKLPGLGLEEAIQGSVNLQAAGFSAKQAEGALKGFGNALATVGKGKAELDGVITALSQMAAKGKISAEEINQIAERVPQIRKVMQQAFGTSNTEELQKMGISASEFVDRVTTELNKLPPVAGGLKNSFENLGDSGKLALAMLGDAINKNLNVEGFFNGLAEKLSALAEGFSNLNPGIQRFIIIGGAIVAAMGPVLVIFGGILAAIPSMVAGYAALKMATAGLAKQVVRLALAYGPLVIQIAAITAAVVGLALIGKSIYDAWDGIAAWFASMWARVKLSFAEALLSIVQSVNKFGKFIGVEFKETEKSLKSLADSAKKNFDATPAVTFTDAMSGVGQAITDNLNSGIQTVKDFFFQTSSGAKEAAAEVTKTADAIKNLAGAGKGVAGRGSAIAGMDTRGSALQQDAPAVQSIPLQLTLLPVTLENMQEVTDSLISHFLQFEQSVNSLITGAVNDSFVFLGDSIAAALSGTGNLQSFFDGFLGIMADFLGNFGKQLITLGVAATGLGKLMAAGPIAAPVAIAAGVALVALAGVAKASLSKGPKFGGGATPSAPKSASPNYGSPGMGGGYGEGKVQFEISGNSLQGVLTREEYRKKRFW